CNMLIIDVGDAVKYESHPEISVPGAWDKKKVKAELKKIRELGMMPIPKLNFSAMHDPWLGQYSYMLSTDIYYKVTRDLIDECCSLFGKPKYFHLGMDEENMSNQRFLRHVLIRQYNLWWKDLYHLQKCVEDNNSRAWVWSDYLWDHPDWFLKKMPKDILQSNWYYRNKFSDDILGVKSYRTLEEHGYDQVPTGSNYSCPENMEMTAEYCSKIISPERLKGFMQTPWHPTLKHEKNHLEAAAVLLGKAKNIVEGK
ncbi:MAG: Tat pathway signal protein, partial [Elusimicrobiota bacterium]